MADEVSIQAQQDALRPIRMFVGALTGALSASDQSYAGYDYGSWNVPGQYQVVGPWGYSMEGQPIAATRGGGLVISPALVMLGIGAAVVLMWKQ